MTGFAADLTRGNGMRIGGVLIGLMCFGAWLTHICIKTASWLLLIAGAICAPIAVVYGCGVWIGAW